MNTIELAQHYDTGFFREVRNRCLNLARLENFFQLYLCFNTNKPGSTSEALGTWATTESGRAFAAAMTDNLLGDLPPEEDCEDYLYEFTKFSMVSNAEHNGRVLERVAYSVIHVCRSLLPDVVAVPYLRPYQLDSCMQHTRPTAVLDMYCYTRISQASSHQEVTDNVHRLLGISVEAPREEIDEDKAEEEASFGETGDIDDGQTVFEDTDSVVADSKVDSEDLFSSQNDCPTEWSAVSEDLRSDK
ncbi:hypothetical protein QBC46DRAFT_366286 [Diplogelasinospora grovesii]|uniref:Uncharacterized protein n=1 Tax=Diplogelasinospora grovesii TaxID=303347 RepID=A0AAN6N3T4_9PEZI|nr:hypothetical protein QBC46DRAFT_366286 [Diplogelasinospora grovesii]